MKMDWVTEIINGIPVTYYRYDITGIEYKATQNPDGSFNVATHEGSFKKVPYVGEVDNYRDMDVYAAGHNWESIPNYVCHVKHNEHNAYVLWAKGKYYYIRIDE